MKQKLIMGGVVALIILVIAAAFVFGGSNDKEVLRISTTTSLEDTGLLNELESSFEKKYPNIDVQIVSAGTGIALKYGESGDADLVIVHDKKREQKFMDEGYGTQRYPFAYNYFYIIGPANDPAKIKGMANASEVFETIAKAGKTDPNSVKFISRGDNSGTNSREIKIWKNTGIDYNDSINGSAWYIETGKGMGDTLIMANEKSAYTISDSGTYLAFKGNTTLVPYLISGKELLNIYSAIPVNPDKVKGVNYDAAMKFVDFLQSPETQDMIGNYGKKEFGQSLFTPLYGGPEPDN